MKIHSSCTRIATLVGAAALCACSKPEAPLPAGVANVTSAASTAVPAVPAPPTNQPVMACAMVTPAAMSAILGAAVIAKPDEAMGRTGCIYTPAGGTGPAVELRVEWGAAQMAIKGVGMAGRAEPGLTNPLAGLGDQAVQVGPAIMIATGEDLVTVVFASVDDVVPKAKAIFALVKARL
jgi:hypothetical protein